MNYVEQPTAEKNLKRAEMVQNMICSYAEFEARVNRILENLSFEASCGRTKMQVDESELNWTNEQGISVKKAIENKGYTFTEHYEIDHEAIHRDSDDFDYFNRDYVSLVMKNQIECAKSPDYYEKSTLITMDGVEGISLEKAMLDGVDYYKKQYEDEMKFDKELQESIEKEAEEERKRKERKTVEINTGISPRDMIVIAVVCGCIFAAICKILF